ncbi:MAG: Cof-type HAD-IIB family hydrolase [Elusimicrobiota bacterium]|jgi:Cof subfamily protein (haloacid dehalogenase superfamily)|nr:Cof-type HAD-IIB family hydrolase [Elusimicrobiota bacterium]
MDETGIDSLALKNVKLIASDMDHTLLTEKRELPPNFNDYILRLNKYNIDFVIASGRPLYTLKTLFPTIRSQMSFISDNGAIVCHKNKIIFKDLLKSKDYQSMIKLTKEKTDGIAIVCGLDCAFIAKENKIYEDYLKIFYSNITYVDNLETVSQEADKFSVYFPNHDAKENYEKIFKPQYSPDFSVTIGDTVWVDIMNSAINKGTALNFLARKLNLTFENTMAFGDTYNDIEMLKVVKYSYIVKNAHPDMKAYANSATDTNDNFGVTKVLDKILANYENS